MRKLAVSLSVLATFCVAAMGVASAGGKAEKSITIKGTVESISADSKSIKIKTSEGSRTIQLSPTLTVNRNDEKSTLREIRAGDQIEATCRQEGENYIATAIKTRTSSKDSK